MGQVIMFGGNFAPVNWLPCDGRLLPISQYDALYSLLGTIYGGDGVNTFGVPNLQSRIPISQGQGPGLQNYPIGQMLGVENVTLTTANLAVHTHTWNASNPAGTTNIPNNNLLATEGGADAAQVSAYAPFDTTPANMTTLAPYAITPAGNGQPHDNIQPYQALTYCICTAGIYPSQN
jgi:microcystin-dependent protein